MYKEFTNAKGDSLTREDKLSQMRDVFTIEFG